MADITQNPTSEQVAQNYEAIQEILTRSATDPDFRKKLLEDPRTAVEEHSGRKVRDDWNVVFIENEADMTIVLPDVAASGMELNEDELEAVAGGTFTLAMTPAVYGVGNMLLAAGAATAAALWAVDEFHEQDGNVCRQ